MAFICQVWHKPTNSKSISYKTGFVFPLTIPFPD
nr:MAG TPA: hypothetical protein [Caudoviricetes sp.]